MPYPNELSWWYWLVPADEPTVWLFDPEDPCLWWQTYVVLPRPV